MCHIPWAQLEHLKTPAQWTKKHPIDHDIIEQLPKDVKLYCLHGRRALTPHRNGEIFWIPWDSKAMKTLDLPRAQWEIPNYMCKCHMDAGSGDLVCGETATKRMLIPPRTYEKFLTRPAYHLFSSTHSAVCVPLTVTRLTGGVGEGPSRCCVLRRAHAPWRGVGVVKLVKSRRKQLSRVIFCGPW